MHCIIYKDINFFFFLMSNNLDWGEIKKAMAKIEESLSNFRLSFAILFKFIQCLCKVI